MPKRDQNKPRWLQPFINSTPNTADDLLELLRSTRTPEEVKKHRHYRENTNITIEDEFTEQLAVLNDYPVGNTVEYTIQLVLKMVDPAEAKRVKKQINHDVFKSMIEKLVNIHHSKYM